MSPHEGTRRVRRYPLTEVPLCEDASYEVISPFPVRCDTPPCEGMSPCVRGHIVRGDFPPMRCDTPPM